MNFNRLTTFGLILVSPFLFAQTLPGQYAKSSPSSGGISDVETKVYMDERKALQSRFSVAQAKLDLKTEASKLEATSISKANNGGFAVDKSESVAEPQLKMEEVNKEIQKLADKTLAYEVARLGVWNNQSFWIVRLQSGNTASYWSSGPSAKQAVEKLNIQLTKIKTTKIVIAGPFKKPDLNESQKMLDAIRNALDLDIELTRMTKQYLNR